MTGNRETLVLTGEGEKHTGVLTDAIISALSAFAITAGMAGVFFTLGGAPVLLAPLLAMGISVMLLTVLSLLTRGRAYGTVLSLVAVAALLSLSFSQVIRGVYAWGNTFVRAWNQAFGTFYEEVGSQGLARGDVAVTEMILGILLGTAVWELIRRKNLLLITGLALGSLCLDLLLSGKVALWMPTLLIGGWTLAWCGISSSREIQWGVLAVAGAMGMALWLLSQAGFGASWPEIGAEYRGLIIGNMEWIRFGEDDLPKGDLTKAGSMLAGEEERLELTVEQPATLYLRGYVGSVYDGNGFRTLRGEDYGGEFSGMLSWLADQGFYPGAQYAAYVQAAPEEKGEPINVTVRNRGASRRYLYLPETVLPSQELKGAWKQDWSMEAAGFLGQREYSFVCYETEHNGETHSPGTWVYEAPGEDQERADFLQAERVYRSFVYEKYLGLEEEQRELLCQVFFQGDGWEETREIYTVTSRIRTVLRILAEYKEQPVQVPGNEDFLSWFLKEGKEGNASYYAAAAVLAYRAAGIPARYVEGYLLTGEEARRAAGETVVLTGKNAHAWVEIYVDGQGFRGVEVTPGFYEELYQADVVVAVPNEDLAGTSGEMTGMPSLEEYELLEPEEEPLQEEKGGVEISWVLLGLLVLGLLEEIARLGTRLYRGFRYEGMSEREQMYVLYSRIIEMLGRLYTDFTPDQPLKLLEKEDLPFDRDLYARTVKRMEGMIYGEREPASREILAARDLVMKLRRLMPRRYRAWK